MSEPRKNHLAIDGAQVKEEENVASYKPIPETDQEIRPPSKASLTKSKERLPSDPAEEKLLRKEDEARIVTRVDMADADAKYVVGDHRNGDAKIELDANKRQFSGLTKEELLKYADDPFWVRLRWFMFVLFWALWLCMLAGAVAIIIRAPKCAPPPPKTWYEIGPLADRTSESAVDYSELQEELNLLASSKVQGVFINPCTDTYEVLENSSCLDKFKEFLEKAKKKSIKVIVDLTANFVPSTHTWFVASENRTSEFADYFVWGAGKDSVPDGTRPQPPNNWVSRYGGEAWSWSEKRRQYYLHQYQVHQADLNFHNNNVVKRFDDVLRKWMAAGAAGVRLLKARQLLVNKDLPDEHIAKEKTSLDSSLKDYMFLRHKETSDRPELDALLAHWAHVVTQSAADSVFTLHEDGVLKPEWYILRNSTLLRPPCAAPRSLLAMPLAELARDLDRLGRNWSALQLTAGDETGDRELVSLAMLLPLTPVLQPGQLPRGNDSLPSESFAHLAALRDDDSIKFGERRVEPVNVANTTAQMIACARWKTGHTGYVAVFNPGQSARADLTTLPSLPASLTVHHVSSAVKMATNYTSNSAVAANSVLVPARSSVVLSYVPKTTAEQ